MTSGYKILKNLLIVNGLTLTLFSIASLVLKLERFD